MSDTRYNWPPHQAQRHRRGGAEFVLVLFLAALIIACIAGVLLAGGAL